MSGKQYLAPYIELDELTYNGTESEMIVFLYGLAEKRQIWFIRGREPNQLRSLYVEELVDEDRENLTHPLWDLYGEIVDNRNGFEDNEGWHGPFSISGCIASGSNYDWEDFLTQNFWFRGHADSANRLVPGQALLEDPDWYEHFPDVWRRWSGEGCLLTPKQLMDLIDGLGPRDTLRTVEECINDDGPQRCVMVIRRSGYDGRTLKVTGNDADGLFARDGRWYASADLFEPQMDFTPEGDFYADVPDELLVWPDDYGWSITGREETTMSRMGWCVMLDALSEVRLNGKVVTRKDGPPADFRKKEKGEPERCHHLDSWSTGASSSIAETTATCPASSGAWPKGGRYGSADGMRPPCGS